MSRFATLARELRAVWMLLVVAVALFIATPYFLTTGNLTAIVLAAGGLYLASMLVGRRGGLVHRLFRARHLEA